MRREGSDSMAATMVLRRRRLRRRSAAKATVESGHLIFPFGAKRANRAKKEQKLITEEQHFCRNLIGLRSLPSPLSLSPFLSLPLSPLYKRARSSRRLSARSLLERKERERDQGVREWQSKRGEKGTQRRPHRPPSINSRPSSSSSSSLLRHHGHLLARLAPVAQRQRRGDVARRRRKVRRSDGRGRRRSLEQPESSSPSPPAAIIGLGRGAGCDSDAARRPHQVLAPRAPRGHARRAPGPLGRPRARQRRRRGGH